MKFIVELTDTPDTGNALVKHLKQAVEMVRDNIGPEPVRFTSGLIFAGGSGPQVGKWSLEESARASAMNKPHCKHCGMGVRQSVCGGLVHINGYFGCNFKMGKQTVTVATLADE